MKIATLTVLLFMLLSVQTSLQGYGWGWEHLGRWGFWAIVFVVLVGFAVYAFLKTRGGGIAGQEKKAAMKILKERYVKGEISREEYEREKKNIEG